MVSIARIGFDEELIRDFLEPAKQGGLTFQTQTAVLEAWDDNPRPEPAAADEAEAEEPAEESQPVPTTSKPKNRRPSSERRHLAGANWLADWTLYFPAKKD